MKISDDADFGSLFKTFVSAWIVGLVFGAFGAWMAQIACAEFWKPVSFWGAFAALHVLGMLGKILWGKG